MAAVAGFNATIEATDTTALDMLYVKSISFGGTSAADVDITHLTSADAIREFVRGTKNPGVISATCIYDGTVHDDWHDQIYDTAVATYMRDILVTLSNGATIASAGFVTGFTPDVGGEDEPVTCTIEIQLTGAPTITLAS